MHYNTAMERLYVVDRMDPSDGYFLMINYDNVDIVHPIYLANVTIETILAMVKAMDRLVTTFHTLYHQSHFPLIGLFVQQRVGQGRNIEI